MFDVISLRYFSTNGIAAALIDTVLIQLSNLDWEFRRGRKALWEFILDNNHG